MNILCINTCLKRSYVSLIVNDTFYENVGEGNIQHSITLMQQIDDIMIKANIDKSQLDYIAVCVGTGSFTGIRIGIAVAKGLANALNLKIIPIDTLSLIAYNTLSDCQLCVMKGVADEYFVGFIENNKVESMRLMKEDELKKIIDKSTKICSCDNIANELNCEIEVINIPKMNKIVLDNLDKAINSTDVKPMYLRLSQAEMQKGHKLWLRK